MKQIRRLILAIICLTVGCEGVCVAQSETAPAQEAPGGANVKVIVGPNILASRDGNFYHAELMVAANPKNPKNLVGAGITATQADGGPACKTYVTFDGGYTWSASALPEQVQFGGADPQVAFSPHGTAYFAALAMVRDEKGRGRAALHFYRSEDGGRTWLKPADLGGSYDHPQIVVDKTYGPYAGRIYIAVLYGYDYSLGIFRSDDDGRTFTGPVKVLDGGGIGVNATPLMVLSDGTLAMTYSDFQIDPARRKTARDSNMWLVTSKDGGISFSKPAKIGTLRVTGSDEDPSLRLSTFPSFAVDNRSPKYRDRIYGAWTDFATGTPRVLFTYSSDEGRTWKEPRPIDTTVPANATQYQPVIAVNEQGTIALMWFGTRGLKDDSEYNVWLAASIDGGETFLPAVQLSSEKSFRWGAGNMAISPAAWDDPWKNIRISFVSAAARWSNGGDYMGLVADTDGIFHPFWADSRTGTFQCMTDQVRVDLPAPPAKLPPGMPPLPKEGPAAGQEKAEVSLNNKIEFIFDPSRYDPASKELLLPIRLKNISTEPIYKPIIVTVKAFGSGMGDMFRDKSPWILNSTNGKQQDGATVDYSSALRDLEALEPNAQTEAIVWRFKLNNPLLTPDMQLITTGMMLKK